MTTRSRKVHKRNTSSIYKQVGRIQQFLSPAHGRLRKKMAKAASPKENTHMMHVSNENVSDEQQHQSHDHSGPESTIQHDASTMIASQSDPIDHTTTTTTPGLPTPGEDTPPDVQQGHKQPEREEELDETLHSHNHHNTPTTQVPRSSEIIKDPSRPLDQEFIRINLDNQFSLPPPQQQQQQRQQQQLLLQLPQQSQRSSGLTTGDDITDRAKAPNADQSNHKSSTSTNNNHPKSFDWMDTGAKPKSKRVTTSSYDNRQWYPQQTPQNVRYATARGGDSDDNDDLPLYKEYKAPTIPPQQPQAHRSNDNHMMPTQRQYLETPTLKPRDEGGEIDKLVMALGQVMNKPSLKGMHFDVPTFSGKESDNFEAWEADFDQYCSLCIWDDGMRIKSLGLVLKERARQIYQDLPRENKTSWPTVITALRAKFGKRMSSELLDCDKLDRVQGPNESVREYTIDVVKRLRNAGIRDEKQRLLIHYRGLLPSIKKTVFLLKPTDLESCEAEALLVERNLQKYGDGDGSAIDNAINAVKQDNPAKPDKQVTFQNSMGNNNRAFRGNRQGRFHTPPRPRHNGPVQTRTSGPHYASRGRGRGQNHFNPRPFYGPPPQQAWSQTGQQQQQFQGGNYNTQRDRYPMFLFCRRCECRHPYGEHVNPICNFCGAVGHQEHECRDF